MRWRDRLVGEPRLATMVTAVGAGKEPLHRWIPYTQGFSPGLVRLFLSENAKLRHRRAVVLDPFCGSGTTVVECARQGVRAIGVEALASMVYLASSRWWGPCPQLPDVPTTEDWRSLADSLIHPLHRAALMLAVGRQHTSSGQRNRGAKPLNEWLPAMVRMMTEDLLLPLSAQGAIVQGDARELAMLADESISGMVTSPPYLSRYDYRETASPYEEVHRNWFSQSAGDDSDRRQLQASPTTTSRDRRRNDASGVDDPSLAEAAACLRGEGSVRAAVMIESYFADLLRVLGECQRVLSPGGVCWMVLGGARIKDVYVPTDLIAAELAGRVGFAVETLRVARDLVRPRRKFGRIGHLAPRETLLVLVKP